MAQAKGDGLTLEYDLHGLKQLPKLMRSIEKAGGRVDPALKRWGAFMLSQTNKTFTAGGRGKVKWKPLSDATLSMRKRSGRGVNPRRILQASGHMKRSIKTVTFMQGKDERAQSVFTRVKYAPIHQKGGTQQFFGTAVNVPQRQFLFISADDRRMAVKLMKKHRDSVVEKAGS